MIVKALLAAVGCLVVAFGPKAAPPPPGAEKAPEPVRQVAAPLTKVKLALNWKPEPEFGGFYAAQQSGAFKASGLEVEILPGGSGTPTVQMVDNGRVEFGVVSADEVVTLRAKGADVVALFSVFQTCPQAIMTHADRPEGSLKELLEAPGTIAWQAGLPYVQHLKKTYNTKKLTEVPYTGGLPFLKAKDFAQQCFVFSEPLVAMQKGTKVKTFLISDSGYNPYTVVVITRGEYLRTRRAEVDGMVKALEAGWASYLNNPRPANEMMKKMNPAMDAELFDAAAVAQEKLILPAGMNRELLGTMTVERWEKLIGQLVTYGVIEKPINAAECFLAKP